MRHADFGRRVTGLLLAVIMSFSCVSPAFASKKDVQDAKNKVSSMEAEKKKLQGTLNNLESLKNDTVAYVKQLDAELAVIDNELADLGEQIVNKEAEIAATGEALEQAKVTEAEQYASMKLRIKYMYERGNTSLLDLLLEAEDFSQMLNRAEYIQQISEYDKQKMDEYVETKNRIAAEEEQLKAEKEELEVLEEDTRAKQASVETLLAEKNKEVKNYESKIDTAKGQITEYQKSIQAEEAKIKAMEAEIKRKEEEERKRAEEEAKRKAAAQAEADKAAKRAATTTLGSIRFIWPCPSSGRISSPFGKRSSPTKGASSYHQGLDIPASSGAAIVAAAAGTVTIATYSYASGNYVTISHGGGVYTVYMHCSSLNVKEGQTVKQGQTIAKVGSTGISTGPHLHFGIRSNGSYVNPSKYVSP